VIWLLDVGCITYRPGYPLPYTFIDLHHPWNVIYFQESRSNQILFSGVFWNKPLPLMQRVHLIILSWTISSTLYHSYCLWTSLCWFRMHMLRVLLISKENTHICIYVCIHRPLRPLNGTIVSRILGHYSHNFMLFLNSIEIIVSETESLLGFQMLFIPSIYNLKHKMTKQLH
jgi:hypothetical protein